MANDTEKFFNKRKNKLISNSIPQSFEAGENWLYEGISGQDYMDLTEEYYDEYDLDERE